MNKLLKIFISLICCYQVIGHTLTFNITEGSDIVGKLQFTVISGSYSLGEIGRKFDVGVYEMIEANPHLDPWGPKKGAAVIIPTEFVLPPVKREGIVINVAEMRLYYFHDNGRKVTTHPIGIGRKGWNTPLGSAKVIDKRELPYWSPPDSIREMHRNRGHILPAIVPPGPSNPLGKYSMRISIPNYLIHGTNRPGGIGVRSTSGCIRLFPEDIENLYPYISIGTSVNIIHIPYKIGKKNGHVFLEAHQPLSDHRQATQNKRKLLQEVISSMLLKKEVIDLDNVMPHIFEAKGFPVLIYSESIH